MTEYDRLTDCHTSIDVLYGLIFVIFAVATDIVLFDVVQGFLFTFQSGIK